MRRRILAGAVRCPIWLGIAVVGLIGYAIGRILIIVCQLLFAVGPLAEDIILMIVVSLIGFPYLIVWAKCRGGGDLRR